MKIISKYKDFYDYLWIDSDPDLVFVRKEKVCFNSVPELEKGISNDQKIGYGIQSDRVSFYRTNYNGRIKIIGYTFGIYPYIYTSPALVIYASEFQYFIKCLSKKEVEKIGELKEIDDQIECIYDIVRNFIKDYDTDIKNLNLDFPKYYRRYTPYDSIMEFCWKKENQDVFLKLASPVFVHYSLNILGDTYKDLEEIKPTDTKNEKLHIVDNEIASYRRTPTYVTNVCFNKISYPVTKYWFDELNNVNTYSNIENFLMTSKMDPEPVISNEGRIIAHGFDLKTSFRKM